MTGNHIVIIKLFKIKRFKTVKTIKTIRTIRTVRTATGEKKGPMALSFPPLPPILSQNIFGVVVIRSAMMKNFFVLHFFIL